MRPVFCHFCTVRNTLITPRLAGWWAGRIVGREGGHLSIRFREPMHVDASEHQENPLKSLPLGCDGAGVSNPQSGEHFFLIQKNFFS